MIRATLLMLPAVAMATAVSAATIDIRDCPIDTLVFVDPWANGEFAVRRVGTDQTWQCPDGVQPPDVNCMGPYGELVLEGMYRQYRDSKPELTSAIWTVVKGVPCCGWSVQEGEVSAIGRDNFKWLAPGEAPTLRDMPWLSIDSDEMLAFNNPVFATFCTTK